MRLATDRSRQTLKPASFCTSPRLAVIRLAPRTDQLRSVPLGSMVLDAFGALGIAARSGLASGVLSLCRLGCTVAGFLHVRRPWLSWASSSLGHSPSRTLASRLSRSVSRLTRRLPMHASAAKQRQQGSASSCIPGRHPFGHRTLCFKFQRSGKLACLFRDRRPLEVCILIPVAGVSDRP
jgi:hypothetical protein